MQVGFLVMGIASLAGLVAMIVTGLEKVHTGHGLDTFRTTWLVEFNWVGFLVLQMITSAYALRITGTFRNAKCEESVAHETEKRPGHKCAQVKQGRSENAIVQVCIEKGDRESNKHNQPR